MKSGKSWSVFFPQKMKISPKKGPFQKEKIVFQPLFFRGYVSFRGSTWTVDVHDVF